MQTQKNTVSTKKANRSVSSGKAPVAQKAIVPVPAPKETFTPLGDAIRKSGAFGEMLIDNIEGLTYYQQAKALVSELFINSLTVNLKGEMSDDYKQLHIDLHLCIQELFDSIHKEYVLGLRQEYKRELEKLGVSFDTENAA